MHLVRCWFGVTGNILYEKLMIKAYQRLSQLLIRLIKRCIAHDSCFYQSPFYHLHSNFHCTLSADHSKDDISLFNYTLCVALSNTFALAFRILLTKRWSFVMRSWRSCLLGGKELDSLRSPSFSTLTLWSEKALPGVELAYGWSLVI